jgi:hypothetical protein
MPALPVPLFVVPRNGVSTLCSVEGGRLVDTCPLPMPPLAEHAVGETGWVAWVKDEGATIHRAHTDAEPHEQRFPVIRMPEGYKAAALAIKGPALYAGGNCGKEVLGMFAIDEPEPTWVPLPIPEQFQRYGKRVDDLLVDGNRLIAVDDKIIPQYLLRYDVSSPLKPALVEVKELPWHTTYEHIERGALGASYLALLSSGVNHGTSTSHVAFYDREGLGARGSFSVVARHGQYRTVLDQDTRSWHDLAWCGDVLLIASDEAGVGLLDLGTISRPPLLTYDQQRHSWRGAEDAGHFWEEYERKLRYLPVPGGKCVRLISVPDTRLVLAVMGAEGKFDTAVLDVDGLLASAVSRQGVPRR